MLDTAETQWIITLVYLDNKYNSKSFHLQNIKNNFYLKHFRIMQMKKV